MKLTEIIKKIRSQSYNVTDQYCDRLEEQTQESDCISNISDKRKLLVAFYRSIEA